MSIPSEAEFLAKLQHDIDHKKLILPTLPEVALQVKNAADDDNITLQQLAGIVATDAALSARLLQVANSPLYRANHHIDNLQVAITRMGKSVARNLVTSFVMQQMFQPTSEFLDQRFRTLWEHSVQVAAISRALAKQVPNLDPEQAMLAGLIHDIGTLPILAAAEEIDELVVDVEALDDLIFHLHPQLGKMIVENWGFPDSLSAVVWQHEDLQRDSGGTPDYTDVVQVANLQAHAHQDHPLGRCDWSQVAAFAKLGLDHAVEIIELEGVADEIVEVEEIFL